MPTRLKNILTIIFGMFLIFFGCYSFFIKNLHHKNFIAEQSKFILEKELAKNKKEIKYAALRQKQIQELNKVYIEESKKLVTISLPLLLDQLQKIAQLNGVALRSVQPLPAIEQNGMVAYPVQFTLIGTYDQLISFDVKLVDAFFFVILRDIKLTKIKDEKLNMETAAIIYGKKEAYAHE